MMSICETAPECDRTFSGSEMRLMCQKSGLGLRGYIPKISGVEQENVFEKAVKHRRRPQKVFSSHGLRLCSARRSLFVLFRNRVGLMQGDGIRMIPVLSERSVTGGNESLHHGLLENMEVVHPEKAVDDAFKTV